MDYNTLILLAVFFSFLNSGVFLLLDKWGILDYYEMHRRDWMPVCTFCFFFWLGLIELNGHLIYLSFSGKQIATVLYPASLFFSIAMAVVSRKFAA